MTSLPSSKSVAVSLAFAIAAALSGAVGVLASDASGPVQPAPCGEETAPPEHKGGPFLREPNDPGNPPVLRGETFRPVLPQGPHELMHLSARAIGQAIIQVGVLEKSLAAMQDGVSAELSAHGQDELVERLDALRTGATERMAKALTDAKRFPGEPGPLIAWLKTVVEESRRSLVGTEAIVQESPQLMEALVGPYSAALPSGSEIMTAIRDIHDRSWDAVHALDRLERITGGLEALARRSGILHDASVTPAPPPARAHSI